jgi:hypothetical protein
VDVIGRSDRKALARRVVGMRTAVFRVLAGLLAVGFVSAMFVADVGQMSLRHAVLEGMIAVVFGVYAAFGTAPAERMLGMLFGLPEPPSGPDDPESH